MRGIIIAAGMGTRMGKLTKNKPKCLLKVGEKTILESTIEGLKHAGCKDILIVTGYKAEEIAKLGYKTIINKDYKKNNILHSFFKAEKYINKDLIVVYSDIYVEKSIFKNLVSRKENIVLTIDKSWKSYYKNRSFHPIKQAEKVVLDKNKKVKEIGKDLQISNEKKYYEFIGLFKVSEKACDILKNTFKTINNKTNSHEKFQRSKSWKQSYLTDFFQYIINNKILNIDVNIISKGWAEFDTLEDYMRVDKIIKSQKLKSLIKA